MDGTIERTEIIDVDIIKNVGSKCSKHPIRSRVNYSNTKAYIFQTQMQLLNHFLIFLPKRIEK